MEGAIAAMAGPSAKEPPHSIEAEQAVLGGLLLNNRAWFDLSGLLASTDFYRQDHQLLFVAIGEMIGRDRPCDFVTLSEHLRVREQLEPAGGLAYLGALAADTPSAANITAYAEIVRERSVLRSLITAGLDIAALGYSPDGRPAEQLIQSAEQAVFDIADRGHRADAQYKALPELMEQFEKRLDDVRSNPNAFSGLLTGFVEFDRLTMGLHDGDLVIVGGRPGMGKTSFALNIAEHVAIERRVPAAIFSMEMSAEQLTLRTISSFARVDQQHLRTGTMDDREWGRVVSAGQILRRAPLFIDETGSLSPIDLSSRARRLVATHGIRLIVVDYIQLMSVPGSRENRTADISTVSRGLKALAKELRLPVIAISQLSRSVEARADKRPHLADLRESGSIEQDADIVAFVYRDDYYYRDSADRGSAEIIVAKQRNGPTGTIKAAFLGHYTRFDNLADPSVYS